MAVRHEQPITENNLYYDVIVTNLDGFTSIEKEVYQEEYIDFDWKKHTVKEIVHEKNKVTPEDEMDNILDQLT